MKAVVLCGGEGSRLRPLTCDTPKPLTHLCGRPVLEYILDKLVSLGVDEAVLTVKYLGESIVSYFDGHPREDIKLTFVTETEPLGTAGCVKNCENVLTDGDFLVVSGDALFDLDLSRAVAEHRKNSADATVIVTKVSDPREYGSVISDQSGHILKFVEKPDWSGAVSDLVNTGIYILSPDVLSLIPKSRFFDFANDLFPVMLQKNMGLFAYELAGYWCDIGSISSYGQCQFDILRGKAGNLPENVGDDGVFCLDEKLPGGDFCICPPVYIGKNVTIGRGAVIGPDAIICDNCSVGPNTSVKRSIIGKSAYIGSDCELRGTVVCPSASVDSKARLFEGSVIGSRAHIGIDAQVGTDVKIWPEKTVSAGTHVNTNLKWGSAEDSHFDDEGISGENGSEITAEFCAALGRAAATLTDRGTVVICHDGQTPSKLCALAAASGAAISGSQAVDIGVGWETLMSSFVILMGYDIGLFFCSAGNQTLVRVCKSDGAELTHAQERKLDMILKSKEYLRCGFDGYGEISRFDGASTVLLQSMTQGAPDLSAVACTLTCESDAMTAFANALMKKLGVKKGKLRFHVTDSGRRITAIDENGKLISKERMKLVVAEAVLSRGEDIALPSDAPPVFDELAKKHQRQVFREPDERAAKIAASQRYFFDAFCSLSVLLTYMAQEGKKLCEINEGIAQSETTDISVKISGDALDAMRRLLDSFNCSRVDGGVRIESAGRFAFCRVNKRGGTMRVSATACDMEAAKELCGEIEKLF